VRASKEVSLTYQPITTLAYSWPPSAAIVRTTATSTRINTRLAYTTSTVTVPATVTQTVTSYTATETDTISPTFTQTVYNNVVQSGKGRKGKGYNS